MASFTSHFVFFAVLYVPLVVASMKAAINKPYGLPEPVKKIDDTDVPRKEAMKSVLSAIYSMDQRLDHITGYLKNLEDSYQALQKQINNKNAGIAFNALKLATDKFQKTGDLKSRYRRDVHDVGEVFVTTYNKAISTSSDVKTLLAATETLLENTNALEASYQEISDDIEVLKEGQATCNRENPKSCLEVLNNGHTMSKVYDIFPDSSIRPIQVYCDQDTDGGGWIVFQRRKDGSVDFFRDWSDYEKGFGDLEGEFWLGNADLHLLTKTCCHELRFDLKDFDNEARYAKYSNFMIGAKDENYALTVGSYSGDAGDSLTRHNGDQFSTKDRDNDATGESCAVIYKGAWWHDNCHSSNLNGLYLSGAHESYADGINWHAWRDYHYSLKFVEMKFRER